YSLDGTKFTFRSSMTLMDSFKFTYSVMKGQKKILNEPKTKRLDQQQADALKRAKDKTATYSEREKAIGELQALSLKITNRTDRKERDLAVFYEQMGRKLTGVQLMPNTESAISADNPRFGGSRDGGQFNLGYHLISVPEHALAMTTDHRPETK